MTIREALELVLLRHKANKDCVWGSAPCCSKLLDDLLSCFPQPSREEQDIAIPAYDKLCYGVSPSLKVLERIFELHDHKYSSKAEWLKAIQFDILQWGNGNWSEPKTWCEHFKQNFNMVKETWELVSWPMILTTSWQFCPICGAKRPPMEVQ